MSLKTKSTTTRWVVIATDRTGQRGFFTSQVWWKGDRRVAKDIRFAMVLSSKEQAQRMVDQWASTQVTNIEYVPITIRVNLKKGGRNNG